MKFENLFWWQYKPSDEREKELYAKAYSRACKVLMAVLVGVAVFFSSFPYSVNPQIIWVLIVGVLLIAYIAGWTVVMHEELSLQKMSAIRSATEMNITNEPTLKAIAKAVGATYGTYILVLLYWPLHVVSLTIIALVAVHVLLSIGAYRVTKQFESTVRWIMVILVPLTAIFFARMKKRSVMSFVAAFVISTVIYAVALNVPVITARTYIVTPFTISTDTFAPALPKGAYRFVDKRVTAKIAVNDFVIIQVDRWYVMQVQKIDGATYTLKNETLGERSVQRKDIVGRVMNETSWFTAFIETQMPQQ